MRMTGGFSRADGTLNRNAEPSRRVVREIWLSGLLRLTCRHTRIPVGEGAPSAQVVWAAREAAPP